VTTKQAKSRTIILDPVLAGHPATKGYVDSLNTAPVKRTRFMSFTNGGNGSNFYGAQTLTSWSGRFAVRLPVTTTRWRWKVRNYGWATGTTNPSATVTGLVYGLQANDSEGMGSGLFVNNAATGLIGSHTAPGDGSWYTSQWFADPNLQFQAGVNHLMAYGFTCPTSRSYLSGAGKCWQHVGDNGLNAINPANTAGAVSSARAGSPLEWVIEYETVTDKLCWLFLGDSIMEGVSGPYGTSSTTSITSPIADSYPSLWAERAQAIVQNLSLASITADNFATMPNAYTRTDLASPGFDGIVIGLGSNDAANGRTLAQFKASLLAIINNLKTYTGLPNVPIYVANITPRPGMTAAQDTVRKTINDWLSQLPYGIKAVIDMDGAFSVGTGTQTPIKLSHTTDLIHFSHTGQWRGVAELRATLPPAPAAYSAPANLYQVVTQAQYDALPANSTSPVLYIIKD
jgi:lysophospholipase L1-like esterase